MVMGRGKGMGMATMRTKLKRKEVEELDQVSHDFSDFSLSSPARKIRRLVLFGSSSSLIGFFIFCVYMYILNCWN